jgi:hypothetical protein
MLKGAEAEGCCCIVEVPGSMVTGMSEPHKSAATFSRRWWYRFRMRGALLSEAGGGRGGRIADAPRFRELVRAGASCSIGLCGGSIMERNLVSGMYVSSSTRRGETSQTAATVWWRCEDDASGGVG